MEECELTRRRLKSFTMVLGGTLTNVSAVGKSFSNTASSLSDAADDEAAIPFFSLLPRFSGRAVKI